MHKSLDLAVMWYWERHGVPDLFWSPETGMRSNVDSMKLKPRQCVFPPGGV